MDNYFNVSRLILDSNPYSVVVLSDKNKLVEVNAAAIRLLGAASADDFKVNFFRYCAPIQPNGMFAGEMARELVVTAFESGETVSEWTFRDSGGELIPCEATLKKIDADGSRHIVIFIRDLRAQIEAEKSLREITERNKIMIDVTPVCFVFIDDGFNVVDCNPAALTLFGVPDAKTFTENFYSYNPSDRGEYITNMQRAFNDGQIKFEWDHVTASGDELPAEVTFIRVEHMGSYRLAGFIRDLREQRAAFREMGLAEQKMREAKELAEESTRIKSNFLANMSHEIRTPMNGILGITNLALKSEMSDGLRLYLEKIDLSAKSLLRIINDILDFSKIEAGRLEIERAEFGLNSVVEEIRSITSPSVMQKNLEFNLNISDEINFGLLGDSLRLQQILLNIVSNAIKFTTDGGISLDVGIAERRGDEVELIFSVKDTGIGMTEEQAESVFDAFGQAESSTARKYGGTGLGLTICKTLVGMMGGKIWLASVPGEGTTFFFTVKMGIAKTIVVSENEEEEFTVPERLRGAKILLAEDNEINRIIATEILSAAGFYIEEAENGEEAVRMAGENKYDLILMDLQMPVMDGFAATGLIRNGGGPADIPILAMTANAMQGDREKSIDAGMNDHITKPLVPDEMLKTICLWLDKKI